MEKLAVNSTPVRTSKNFKINDIELQNLKVPENIESFENVTVTNNSSKIKIDNLSSTYNIEYGISKEFTEKIFKEANQKIRILVGSLAHSEVVIDFKFDSKNVNLLENIEIIAEKNSKATIIIKYTSDDMMEHFHSGLIKTVLNENSNINIIFVNLLGTKTNNFIALDSKAKENAKLKLTVVDFGAALSVSNLYTNLLGKASKCDINSIYLGAGSQLFDLNYIGHLRGEKSDINIEVQGALTGKSRKHFKGTIDFKKGSKKAKGNENENCILLSDEARSLALPMLLCSEEDVEGNHSSSAGKIDEKALFYIMSRGFSLEEAKKLIVRAKFNKILDNIKNEEIKSLVLEEIDRKLDS